MSRLRGLLRGIVLAPVRLYRRLISPLMPQRCRYHPSCSQYAVESVEQFGVLRGSVLAAWRLLRCNPWSRGGIDRVEDQTLFRSRETVRPTR